MNPRTFLLGILIVILCSACGPSIPSGTVTPASTPLPSSTTSPTRFPTATPTPQPPLVVSEVSSVLDPGEGTWYVVGLLENVSDHALGDIELQLRAWDVDGDLILDALFPGTSPAVVSGGRAPFFIPLPSTATPEAIELRPANWNEIDLEPADMSIEITDTFSTGLREYVLGEIRNEDTSRAAILHLAVIQHMDEAGVSGFGRPLAGPSSLSPAERAPFMAELIPGEADGTLTPFLLAERVEAPAPPINIAFSKGPDVRLDPQGNPFLIGEVANEADTPSWLSILLGIRLAGDWVQALEVNHPLPLEPGERRAFSSLELPGLRERLAAGDLDPEDLEVESWSHHRRAGSLAPSAAPLQLDVRMYELIGSNIFIRGTMTNAGTLELHNPTVHATILGAGGRLVSAAWDTPTISLAPGAAAEFLLQLPLAGEENPTTFEPHVWAAGLLNPPPAE